MHEFLLWVGTGLLMSDLIEDYFLNLPDQACSVTLKIKTVSSVLQISTQKGFNDSFANASKYGL